MPLLCILGQPTLMLPMNNDMLKSGYSFYCCAFMDFVFPGGMAGQLDPTNVDVLVNKPLENQRKK